MITTELQTFEQEHARFLDQVGSDFPSWTEKLRQDGLNRFLEKGVPSTREEEWRFTNIAPLLKQTFHLPTEDVLANIGDADVESLVNSACLADDCELLVFVNGHFSSRWSRISTDSQLLFHPLADSIRSGKDIVRDRLVDGVKPHESVFLSLNSAFMHDGAHIEIPDDTILTRPIHLVFLTIGSQPIACHPRNLISAGRNSKATIIESHLGRVNGGYFSNSFTDVVVGESAELQHHKLQQEHIDSIHLATMRVRQYENSVFFSNYFSFGSALARNEIECYLDGEEIECNLNGLYMPTGTQLMDCRTRIDHATPNCRSNELYKGILDDKGKGVFNGKIFVHQPAQKTNAMQSNQAILLSDDAVIDTKPQLEIYADDVRCTHGATVGELDAQALHYLRTRGIPLELARTMLIFAFANDIVQSVENSSVRKYLESLLLADRGLPEV